MSETARIVDQFTRAFEGGAWHGPALFELLAGVTAEAAARRPAADVHTIWEIVHHLAAWHVAVRRRIDGEAVDLIGEEDWPPVAGTGESEWKRGREAFERGYRELRKKISEMGDARLGDRVPGKSDTFYVLLHGVVQHDLYHAGQIALLKKSSPEWGRRGR